MARVDLPVQAIVKAGIVPAFVAGDATNEHEFVNDGETYVELINASGGNVVAVFDAVKKVAGDEITDRTVTIAAGTTRKMGPFEPNIYNQSDGVVHLDLDVDTSVTLGAFSLKN